MLVSDLAVKAATVRCYAAPTKSLVGSVAYRSSVERHLLMLPAVARDYVSFAEITADALSRQRYPGQQHVKVEHHLHVHEGAQAVVGSVVNAGGNQRR
jgi:hypothetical protein